MVKFLKRLGSLALAILMVASLLPVSALQVFAAEDETTYVAQIGTVQYTTLAEAAAAAGNQKVITLLADCSNESISVNQNISIKQNGFNLDGISITVAANKSLTIYGEGGSMTGTTTISGGVKLNGVTAEDMVVTSGTLTLTTDTGSTAANVTLTGTGVLKGDFSGVTGTITATAHVLNYQKALFGYYADMDMAVAATNTKYTLTLDADVVRTTPIVPSKWIYLDLNGHDITVADGCTTAIVTAYNLTVTDKTDNATVEQGKIIAPTPVECSGVLTVSGGAVLVGQIGSDAVLLDANDAVVGYYGTVQAAITAAGKNYTVKLLRDVELTDAITVASGKTLYLDLNGCTLSQTKQQTEAYSMIVNNGTLTIEDSVGTGKISYTDSGTGGEYVSNTITNCGTLTVTGGTLENGSATVVGDNGYPYVIDNNSTSSNAALSIKGGTLQNDAYCTVRQFCNSTAYTNELTITDGILNGGIEFQNPNANANLGTLKIAGGTVKGNSVAALFVFGSGDWSNMTASITGGEFEGAVTVKSGATLTGFITGGVYDTDVTEHCATGLAAVSDGNGKYIVAINEGAAQIGDTKYVTLEAALQAVKADETIVLLKDITIETDNWDSRDYAIDYPITLDGNGKTLTYISGVVDLNGNYVLRLNETSTVKNLTLDLSQTTYMMSGIAAKKGITLENCTLIGNGMEKTRAIQYGASAGANIADLEAVITDCTFQNWHFGVSDNQSGYDAKSVTVTGSTFDNASVLISAHDTMTFTGNTIKEGSFCRIESYTGRNGGEICLSVVAWDNTMDRHEDGWITNVVSYEQIQWEFYCYAPAGVIVENDYGYYYDTLARAFNAALEGQTVRVLQDCELDENVEITKQLTLDLNDKTVLDQGQLFTNTSNLTIIGDGTLDTEIRLTDVNATVIAVEDFLVTSGVDGYMVVWENGVYYLTGVVATVTDADGNVENFTSLEAAVAAAEEGETVTLLKDVTIDELIKIEKAITLDLGANTVTATSKKAFEVYADATIMNGTIEAANRAVDTRTAVALTLTDVNLIADEYTAAYGNPQPLTIGGSTNGTKVTMNNVTIDAGTSGYGIITFVETDLTATDCDISGYMALYVKAGSENSEFTFTDSNLTGDNSNNDVEGNTTGAIQTEADNVTVTVTGGTVNVPGTNAAAIVIADGVTGTAVTADTTINGNILLTDDVDTNTITVRDDYETKLTEEGYTYEDATIPEMVTVTGKAVASVNGILFSDLLDALDYAEELGTATVIVLTDIQVKYHIVVNEGITLELNSYSITTTKTFTVYGDVIDGTVGGYGYVSATKVHLKGLRSFLPIYDTEVGGYRFYDYQLINLGGKAAGENSAKFGIRLLLSNQDGYAVLANTTDPKLNLHALVTWDSLVADIDYSFQTTTLQRYARLVAEQVSTGQSITKAITLTIIGLDEIPTGELLRLTPELRSETKMTVTGNQEAYIADNA